MTSCRLQLAVNAESQFEHGRNLEFHSVYRLMCKDSYSTLVAACGDFCNLMGIFALAEEPSAAIVRFVIPCQSSPKTAMAGLRSD